MCGITGIVDYVNGPNEYVLENMTDALTHRGPDSGGCCKFKDCALGHRRLSIIDLSESANQPMLSDDGQTAIVFNGEIYNFKILRELLESRGQIFRTKSDTEVLLKLYIDQKFKMLTQLNGMFSFAIWDEREKLLFLARDRMGKKPLYYSHWGKRISFSSEIGSLMNDPEISRSIDPQAMSEYFLYDFIPAPHTIFSQVKKLPAAHMAIVDPSGVKISRYWTPPEPDPVSNYEESKSSLLEILTDSTNKRLVADVPLGAFLSGGIDSTIVTALMSKSASEKVRTFSISFPGTTHDEAGWSRLAAKSLGSDHEEHRVDFKIEELFPKLVHHFGEPFGDSSAIPTWRLCQKTKNSVTVALSGDGGDELFGGYERYVARRLQNLYDCLPTIFRKKIIEPLILNTRASTEYYGFSMTKKLKLFVEAADRIRTDGLALTPQTFTRQQVNRLTGLNYDPGLDPAIDHAERWMNLDPVSRMMFTDLQTYLSEDILTKVDRTSMAHALEVRSPFLDYRLVEFACRLPLRFKIHGRTTKRILRDATQDLVPSAILKRSKQGFQVPLGKWFKESLKHWAEQRLFESSYGLLDREVVGQLWRDHQENRADNASKIWLILFFNEWNDQFGCATSR